MVSNNPFIVSYQLAFRRDVHRLILLGFEKAKSQITSKSDETEITGLIAEALEELIDSKGFPEDLNRYAIYDEPPLPTPGKTGKRRRRGDLQFIHLSGLKPRPRYIFEAKRLGGSSSISRYLGADGLMRFVNGIYASSQQEAGMLAYIQNKEIKYWESALLKRFASISFSNPKNHIEMVPHRVLAQLSNTWKSSHIRTNKTKLTLCHILLKCSR